MKLSEESRSSEVGAPASLLASSKNAIYLVSKWVAIVTIVGMFLSLLAGVVVRYVLSTNLGWVAEVPNLLFPWLTMSAIVAAAAKNEHIGIDLVVEKLPGLPRKSVVLIVNAIALIAFGTMAVHALDVVGIAGSQRLPITQIPMSWAYWSVVIGFIGLAIDSLINIALVLTGGVQSSEPQVSHGEDGI